MTTTREPLTAARATALFVSGLSAYQEPSRAELDLAIRQALRVHGGTRRCAAAMAATYGDYPEVAALRMRWARRTVETLYRQAAVGRP